MFFLRMHAANTALKVCRLRRDAEPRLAGSARVKPDPAAAAGGARV